MAERLNLSVDDGVGELLTTLAGGERKRGQWLSDMIRGQYTLTAQSAGADLESLRLSHTGLVGLVKSIEGRLLVAETRLNAAEMHLSSLIADNAAK